MEQRGFWLPFCLDTMVLLSVFHSSTTPAWKPYIASKWLSYPSTGHGLLHAQGHPVAPDHTAILGAGPGSGVPSSVGRCNSHHLGAWLWAVSRVLFLATGQVTECHVAWLRKSILGCLFNTWNKFLSCSEALDQLFLCPSWHPYWAELHWGPWPVPCKEHSLHPGCGPFGLVHLQTALQCRDVRRQSPQGSCVLQTLRISTWTFSCDKLWSMRCLMNVLHRSSNTKSHGKKKQTGPSPQKKTKKTHCKQKKHKKKKDNKGKKKKLEAEGWMTKTSLAGWTKKGTCCEHRAVLAYISFASGVRG